MSKTVVDVNGHELTFVTTVTKTVVFASHPPYEKIVARHKKDGRTKLQKHKASEHLFNQYIEDYKRCLNSDQNSIA